MSYLIPIVIILSTVVLMECFAWWMHKYLLHGPLWFLHVSHHSPRKGLFEWNDLVSLIYAIPAIVLVALNWESGHWSLWVGIGITLYGILYFFLHDVIIHRRAKWHMRFTNSYINRLIRAHRIHHRSNKKEGGEAFGFLYAIKKYGQRQR